MEARQLNGSRIVHLLAEAEHSLAHGLHPERARLDAEAMLLYIFRRVDPSKNRAWLLAHKGDPTSSDARTEFKVLLRRRLSGEPIQYITGETEFFGLPFQVSRDVLIPRPETEHLVEKVIELASEFSHPRILDTGTGSGAIAVALATKLPDAAITATDISAAALDVARKNADQNVAAEKIVFLEGAWLAPVARQQFEIVVSNPPYVAESDRSTLAVEVREHEPALALFAGDDGLAAYRALIPAAHAALIPGGWIALEIGYGQETAIRGLLGEFGFAEIDFAPDLQGIPRVAVGRRR